jgi:orotate phosphoribosyltransferase-like protein
MSKMKDLVLKILELNSAGWTDAEIATALELGRDLVHYVIDSYAEGTIAG